MTAPARRNGVCPVCLRAYQLCGDGTMRRHRNGPDLCPGARRLPTSVVLVVSAEDVPTGRFGGPRPRPPDVAVPDPHAAWHRAVLASAIRPTARRANRRRTAA